MTSVNFVVASLIVLLTNLAVAAPGSKCGTSCPKRFKYSHDFGAKCMCYQIVPMTPNIGGEEACATVGGQLASVHSGCQNDYLASEYQSRSPKERSPTEFALIDPLGGIFRIVR